MSQFKLANEIIDSKEDYTDDIGSSKEKKSTTDGTKLPTTDVTNSMIIDDTKTKQTEKNKNTKILARLYNEKL